MPERDIESLGVMGWGVGWGWKFCRRRRRRRRPPEWVFLGEMVSSRLGLRTEISARYRLQMNRTDGPHLFCFHENARLCEEKKQPHALWKHLTNFLWKIPTHFYLLTSLIILTLLIL